MLHEDVYTDGLSELTAANILHVCSALPANYAGIAAVSLGTKATPTIAAASERTGGGYERVVDDFTDGTVTGSGKAIWIALADSTGERLLATKLMQASKTLTGTGTFALPEFAVGLVSAVSPVAERAPIVHYRIFSADESTTQWAGLTLQQLLDAGVLVNDVMYEIDMGRWKVFNGVDTYDNHDYVTQTAGAVDHLLNIFGQINIINMALGRLGQAPIKDLNENTPGARWGQQFYRITVSEVMASYDWSSAIVRQQMSLVPDELSPGVVNPDRNHFTGYELQYYVPQAPKPIRVSHLFTHQFGAYQRSDVDFRIEGDYLFTNLAHAGLVYVGDYTAQTGRLDPFIIELIVLRLASRMAFAVTSSERMTQHLIGEYAAKMAEAQFADASRARESTNIDVFPQPQTSWTREW